MDPATATTAGHATKHDLRAQLYALLQPAPSATNRASSSMSDPQPTFGAELVDDPCCSSMESQPCSPSGTSPSFSSPSFAPMSPSSISPSTVPCVGTWASVPEPPASPPFCSDTPYLFQPSWPVHRQIDFSAPSTSPCALSGYDTGPRSTSLRLQSLLGPTTTLPLADANTVSSLQRAVARIYRLCPTRQRMVLGSVELDSFTSASDYARALSLPADGQEPVLRVLLHLPPAEDHDGLGYFKLLPDELSMQIFSLLSIADIGSLGRVSKKIREKANDCTLWRSLYARYWCPYSDCARARDHAGYTWKELYKLKEDSLKPQTACERGLRAQVDALVTQYKRAAQESVALARVPPINLGLIEKCVKLSIGMGAPLFNRGDLDGCYRLYFTITRTLVSALSDCPGLTPLCQQGLRYLRDSLKLSKKAMDADHSIWSLRHGFDSVLALVQCQQFSTKTLLNLGESYCKRHYWPEAEGSMAEALQQSFEFVPIIETECQKGSIVCHSYLFFMYMHTLVMQGKYTQAYFLLVDGAKRNTLTRLHLSKFPHTLHFIDRGLKVFEAALGSNLSCHEAGKIMILRMYYTYAGSPTASQLAMARHTACCILKLKRDLPPGMASVVTSMAGLLAQVEPIPSGPSRDFEVEDSGEAGSDDEV